jgi:hypothetical protein
VHEDTVVFIRNEEERSAVNTTYSTNTYVNKIQQAKAIAKNRSSSEKPVLVAQPLVMAKI